MRFGFKPKKQTVPNIAVFAPHEHKGENLEDLQGV